MISSYIWVSGRYFIQILCKTSGEHKERRLLQFLREYMLLAEIAYIEQIAPVSWIQLEVPKFRNNYSDYVDFAICVIGRDSRS